jgi:DNA mismatch repair protein MutS2
MTRERIDEHTLKVLEFGQVLELLASFASNDLGRQAARTLYPSVDADWIQRRLAETTQLKNLLEREIRIPLAGVTDIRQMLTEFGVKRTVFEPDELLEICDTLQGCGRLKKFFAELEPAKFEHLCAMGARLGDYSDICTEINRCIETESGHGRIRDHASERLLQVRQQIAHLAHEIQRRFRTIILAPELRSALENDKFMMRHGRPVVAIKAGYRSGLRGTVLDRSNTGATLYIEPDALVELSNELEDAVFEEKKEVGRILFELSRLVLQSRDSILASLDVLGLIDLTYAKARFSMAYNMAAPEISERTFLQLRQARHPLLLRWAAEQKCCEVNDVLSEIVPIDVRVGDDFDLLIVTGPNTGGKTVMLKTIGLLTLMTQSGLHIPARSDSAIPAYLRIYADIGDEQSIQQSLSTFSAHMQQIVRILEKTNDRTLVLLDELGAGTDPIEGSALATAILDKLLAKRGHAIATTHLGQLKSYAYRTPRVENASVQFDAQTLKPTYELLIGTPGSSNALAIAARIGMPTGVIEQAQSLLAGTSDGTTDLINQVQNTRQDAERKRARAQQILDQAKLLRTRARQQLARVRQEADLLKQQADKAIDDSMQKVLQLLGEYGSQMKNATKPYKDLADKLSQQVSDAADSTPLAARHAKFIESLRKGDNVYVMSFRRQGIVDKIHRKRRTIVVIVEGKQVEVPLKDVRQTTDTV